MIKQYLKNILKSIDLLLNTMLGGSPEMTISSRLGRNYKGTWMAKVVDFLFSWQKRVGSTSHVENAAYWEDDIGTDAIIAQIKKDNHLG